MCIFDEPGDQLAGIAGKRSQDKGHVESAHIDARACPERGKEMDKRRDHDSCAKAEKWSM